MSYLTDPIDGVRHAGIYAAKILNGAKIGDLAIEQASKFTLVINLKTAKALGITVPSLHLAGTRRRGHRIGPVDFRFGTSHHFVAMRNSVAPAGIADIDQARTVRVRFISTRRRSGTALAFIM